MVNETIRLSDWGTAPLSSNKAGSSMSPESVHPDGIEHRQFYRTVYQVEVTLESESNFYNGFTENISAGGLFVATYDCRPIGETLSMELTLPGMDGPISIQGEVRWVREYNPSTPDMTPGMGVRYVNLPDNALSAIEAFARTKDPMFFDDE